MTADIPEWDPATFKPTHTTRCGNRVQVIDRKPNDHRANVRFDDGRLCSVSARDLTPITEPVTAREQWGYIIVTGQFIPCYDERTAVWLVADWPGGRRLAQLKAIDGQIVLCDGDGNPVQVAQ